MVLIIHHLFIPPHHSHNNRLQAIQNNRTLLAPMLHVEHSYMLIGIQNQQLNKCNMEFNDFYKGNPLLPKAGTRRNLTPEQIEEFKRCAEDPVYFANNYFYAVHQEHGLMQIKLYDYQKEAINVYNSKNRLIMLTARQVGKTTVATAIILHTALFNKDKNIALLANLQATAIEILDRIKEAFENLPDFLKQGVKIWNKKTVKFENGCTIFANASKGSSIRGKSIFMLYIDECAFVENWEDFAASTLPTITSNKNAKIIYTSTPNGLNHFYEYCKLAAANKNGFGYIEVPWYKVEGRDEAWKEKTLQDMNYDYQRFSVEQECEFMGSSGTLINGATLKMLEPAEPVYDHEKLKVYKPKIGNHIYSIIVDSSEGKGLDYSAFSVIDITSIPYEQVATFKSNTITPQDYARIIHAVCGQYNNPFVLIELNCPAGAIVAELLWWDYEYENLLMTENMGRKGKKISTGFGGKKADRGIFTSVVVKATGCTMLKLLVEQKQLLICDKETIDELRVFSKKGKSYEAEEGKHDDLVMGLVLFGWLATQQYFKQMTDVDVNKGLVERTDDEIDDYVKGLGIMVVNTGEDEINSLVDTHIPVYF